MIKKILLFIFVFIVLAVTAILVFGPDYTKDYIEEHDMELVGRKITIANIDLNVFNGNFTIAEFKMYELDTQKVFVQFDTLFTDLTFYTIFKGEFLTEALYIKNPKVAITVANEAFNFIDLLPTEEATVVVEEDTTQSFIKRFTINDIKILDGEINYENQDNLARHNLKGLNFKVPGISFGDKHTSAGIEFAFIEGGSCEINLDYQLSDKVYSCDLKVNDLDLHPYLIYMQPALNITDLQGGFSSNLLITGDLDEPGNPVIKGDLTLKNVLVVDGEQTEIFKLKSVFLEVDNLDVKKKQFIFGKLTITEPYVHGIVYKEYTNLQKIIKEVERDTLIKAEIDDQPITYLVEDFALNNGTFYLQNKSLTTGEVEYTVSDINFKTKHLTEGVMVQFDFDALLNGKGKLKGMANLDPANPGKKATFDLDIKDLPIKDFSLYSLQSTAYPINGGRLSFQVKNKVNNNWLNSHFVMKIYKTQIGDKNKSIKPEIKVPLKFGVSVLEDQDKRINIDMPVEGDLSDPEFKYTKLIWKAVINVLVKAVASPYNFLAENIGAKEEDIKSIKYDEMQVELHPRQTEQLDLIAKLLQSKPELVAEGSFTMDEERERKMLKYYIAKRGFYLQKEYKSDTADVALNYVDKVKIYDMEESPKLIKFLEKKTDSEKGTLSFKQLVNLYVREKQLDDTFNELMGLRQKEVEKYLIENGMSNQFKVLDTWVDDKKENKPLLLIKYKIRE